LVNQLRFTRSEFVRGLSGVSDEEALQRLGPMNCISWIVGHLANQEHAFWVVAPTGRNLVPALEALGYGRPASTPPLGEMWQAWRTVTKAADEFLDTLTTDKLLTHLQRKGKPAPESIGTMLYRNIFHYWYHLGEGHAIRQQLGHRDLPQFVGDMSRALYRPE
jgi:uncharacterized damage-inducible protein DinB